MSIENYGLEKYKKILLNRVTIFSEIVDSIESCILIEDKAAKYYFHKIIIHNWQDTLHELFDRLSGYFGSVSVPIKCLTQGERTTFYTSNLNLILKIIKFDFMFPYNRNMFNLDVLFNDICSPDIFGSMTTVDEIVSGVVSRRFNEKCELDLSNFCDDPEFVKQKMLFYKISLLANFKILMLRMGRDTKTLNLSNNNLSQIPLDVLNFFIKADLTAMNFSNNNIPSIGELSRVSSKIEKLWLEGNPLCEDLDPVSYVKTVTIKFPRLTELDGVQLNQNGIVFPFFRNYLSTPDRKTKMVVEKFVTLYFSNYDQHTKRRKKRIQELYSQKATFTLSTDFLETETNVAHYVMHTRNSINPSNKLREPTDRIYSGKRNIANILATLPETVHDRSTFTIDVLLHDKKSLHLIIDGLFKEKFSGQMFQFRRTFIFSTYIVRDSSVYHITNDLLTVTHPNQDQRDYGFQNPVRNMNSLTLIGPTSEEREAIIRAFQHLTQLKKTVVELRLKYHSWDLREALKTFVADAKAKKMPGELFNLDSDFSDSSSILDEIDY